MTDLLKTAESARKFLLGFVAIKELADVIENVGSLVQAKGEAERELAALRPKIDAAKETLAATEAASVDSLARAQATIDKAVADAAALVADAQTEAGHIRAEAQAYNESTTVEANSTVASAQEAVDVARSERSKLLEETKALEDRAYTARAYLARLAAPG